jgi:pyruvate/2-oxoglutarate dehydrogenase complex dihydrolipoamide acyltransferase (E2) component
VKENATVKLTEVRIPFMGSVENATILRWVPKEGDVVTQDGVLCEIETDKTVMEIQAPASGVLAKRLVGEGTDLKVGALIGYLADEGASPAEVAALLAGESTSTAVEVPADLPYEPGSHADKRPGVAPRTNSDAALRVSPYARRLAKEHDIDLQDVLPVTHGRRIYGADVLHSVSLRTADSKQVNGVHHDEPEQRNAPARAQANGDWRGYEGVPFELKAFSARRRTIARRLSETASEAPHLTADVQVDLTRVLDSRKAFNALRAERAEAPVSLLAFLIKAACATLKKYPELNASYTDAGLKIWKAIHIGIAVDTPEGLVVPVIRDADMLTVSEIDAALKALAAKARDSKLTPADLEGGTFTISNPGSVGPVLRAEAILNAPQVALLGFPAMLHTPVAVPGGQGEYDVTVRPLLRPSLTFDHRPLDGGTIVRYLTEFKNRVETMVFD